MSMLDIFGRQYDSGATYDLEEGVPGVRGGTGPRLTAGLVPNPGTTANQAPGLTPAQAARNANVSTGGGVGVPQPGEGGPLGVSQGRNLFDDPLSRREVNFANMASKAVSALPFGGIVSAAMDYNMGRDVAMNPNARSENENAPGSMAGRAGFFAGKGAGFTDSLKGALATSWIGQKFGMSTEGIPGSGQIAPDGGLRGWSTQGYAPGVTVGGPMTGFGPVEARTLGADEMGSVETAANPAASVETAAEPTPAAPPSGYETYGSQGGWGNFGSGGNYNGAATQSGYGVGPSENSRASRDAADSRSSNTGGGYTGAGGDRDAQGGLKVTGGTIRADGRFEGPGAYADGGIIEQGTPAGLAYAAGGFIDPGIGGGEPQAQGPGLAPVGQQQAFNPQLFAGKMQNMLQSNPQMMQKLQMAVQQAVQSGQVTPQQIMQLSQIAQACLQNPQLYPKLLQMAEQQGLVPPGRLPREFNQGIVTALAAVGHGLQHMQGAQQQGPQGAMVEQPQQGGQFASGGMIHGPGTGRSDSIHTTNRTTGAPVSVSNGEYIIPAHVVEIKGKEFFDNLLRKYANVRKEA